MDFEWTNPSRFKGDTGVFTGHTISLGIENGWMATHDR